MNVCKYKTVAFKDNTVDIVCLYQGTTYSGLVGGLPIGGINKFIIKEIVGLANEYFSAESIKIIQPKLKVEKAYDDKKVEYLPNFYCIAEMFYKSPKVADYMCSKAVLIWFQDKMTFPIDKDVLIEIKNIKWETIAEDVNL